MTQKILALSKLSRGQGYDRGPYIEILYDDEDVNNLHYTEFLQSRSGTRQSSRLKLKPLSLPKTFSTKRGQLLLFSEDYIDKIEQNEEQVGLATPRTEKTKSETTSRSIIEPTLNTTSELRNTILTFGLSKDNANDDFISKRENSLAYLKLVNNKNKESQQFSRIRPGYSAKRYLANWSKYWNPDLFNNLYEQGKLCEENFYEKSTVLPNTKHRIDDDISRVPPAYRIQRQWLTLNIGPLKGYRFFRTNSNMFEIVDESTITQEKFHEISADNIRVLDKDGNEIDYTNLDKHDQELLLTELLFQTALYHINSKHDNSLNSFSSYMNKISQSHNPRVDYQEPSKKVSIKKIDGNNLMENMSNKDHETYMFRSVAGHKLSLNEDYKKKKLKNSTSKSDTDGRDYEFHSRSVSPQEYYAMNQKTDSVFNKASQGSDTRDLKKKSSENSSGPFIVAPDGNLVRLGQKLSLPNRKNDETSDKSRSNSVASYFNRKPLKKYQLDTFKINDSNLYTNSMISKYSRPHEDLIDDTSTPQLPKELLLAIANHAQQIAKFALQKDGSGICLVQDVKYAIHENYKNFKLAFKNGDITTHEYHECNELIKNTLKNSLMELFSQSNNLNDIAINDELLENLLDYPPDAFELEINKEGGLKIIKLKSFYGSLNVETNEKNENQTSIEPDSNKITVDLPKENTVTNSIESNDENLDSFDEFSINLQSINTQHELKSSVKKIQLENEQKKEQEPLKIETNKTTFDSNLLKVSESERKNHIKPNIESVSTPPHSDKLKSKSNKPKEQSNKVKKKQLDSNKKVTFKVGKVKESKIPTSIGPNEQENRNKKEDKIKKEEIKDSNDSKELNTDDTLVHMYANENILKINDESSQDFSISLMQRDELTQIDDLKPDLTERRVRINLPNLPPEQNIIEAEELEIDLNDALLKGLNAAELREYKRKLAAEQKKKDLLKKRLEKEEAQRREEEEAVKRAELAKKMEEERLRRAEEARQARLAEQERRRKKEQEAFELAAKLAAQEELERKMREEKMRQNDLLKFKMMEEMARKAKLEQERLEEEERRRREEEAMIAALNEEERKRYLVQKQLEEEQRRLQEEFERKQREEELERALKEAKERAIEEARLKAEIERHLRFIRTIHDESKNLIQSQSVTRAFVFSYYELLQYLGHHIPSEFLPKTKQPNDGTKKYSMNNAK